MARKLSDKRVVLGGLVVMLLLAVTAFGAYYYSQYQKVKKNPQIVVKQETQSLVDKVSKLIDVPKDEEPTVATVADKSKLKDQPFFNNAENGDKILIFTKARKAIVYREKTNKLINVGPLNLDNKAQVAVGIINGGGNVDEAQKKLNTSLGGAITIVGTVEAKDKSKITKTTVVDISGQNADTANQVAQAIGGEVATSLPVGEIAPANATVVVLLK